MKLPAQRFHQLADQLGAEKVRRAATEVQLDHIAIAVKQRRNQGNLALQPMQIGGAAAMIAGDDAIAAAVETRADAERHRSEEHTSEIQSLMRISYAVFCLKKKNKTRR